MFLSALIALAKAAQILANLFEFLFGSTFFETVANGLMYVRLPVRFRPMLAKKVVAVGEQTGSGTCGSVFRSHPSYVTSL
jgi:hypothetical protein